MRRIAAWIRRPEPPRSLDEVAADEETALPPLFWIAFTVAWIVSAAAAWLLTGEWIAAVAAGAVAHVITVRVTIRWWVRRAAADGTPETG